MLKRVPVSGGEADSGLISNSVSVRWRA